MFSGIFLSLTQALVLGKHLISIAQTTCVFIFILMRLLQNWALFQAASVLVDKKFFFRRVSNRKFTLTNVVKYFTWGLPPNSSYTDFQLFLLTHPSYLLEMS